MRSRDQTYIYGTHAVSEALKHAAHAVRHLYVVGNHGHEKLVAAAKDLGIPFDRCDEDHIPVGVERGATHQGVIALVTPGKILLTYKDFIRDLTVTPATALLVLDELTDPQNVGAAIRSAAAFGVAGVLIPEHRQAPVTGTVVKVSAGMAFAVPLVSVGNVNTVLRDLKERGFWIYGLVGTGNTDLAKENFTKPSVFVLGNEGVGLREKTEEVCDFTLSIPIDKRCESLNAAASAAVVLYAWRTQHAK
jgi:23S rRNA (guanosine2251-2'-O)-methyltransferase